MTAEMSFSKTFLNSLKEGYTTISSITNNDRYSKEDQLELVNENPDIITKMDNPDDEVFDYIIDHWNFIDKEDKITILSSKYGDRIQQSLENLEKDKPAALFGNADIDLENQLALINDNPINITKIENPYIQTVKAFQHNLKGKHFGYHRGFDPIVKYYEQINPNIIDRKNPKQFTNEEKSLSMHIEMCQKAKTDLEFLDQFDQYLSLQNLGRKASEDIIYIRPEKIKYFKDADESLENYAIVVDPFTIFDVLAKNKKLTHKQIYHAINQSTNVLLMLLHNHIKIPEDILVNIAKTRDPYIVTILKNPSERLVNAAIMKRPSLIYYIKNPSNNLKKYAFDCLNNLQKQSSNPNDDKIRDPLELYKKSLQKDNNIPDKPATLQQLKNEDHWAVENLKKAIYILNHPDDDDKEKFGDTKNYLINNPDVAEILGLIALDRNTSINNYEADKKESLTDYLKRMEKTLLSE